MIYLKITLIFFFVALAMGEYIAWGNKGNKNYEFTPKEDRIYSYIFFGIIWVIFMVAIFTYNMLHYTYILTN